VKRYRIRHRTGYRFSLPVTLGPHRLRLRPRESHALRIERSTLDIHPSADIAWHFDAAGNSLATAWFDGPTSELTIDSDVTVQQYNLFVPNLADIDAMFRWSRDDAEVLAPYRRSAGERARPDGVAAWLDGLGCGDERLTGTLLRRINETIAGTLSYVTREEEGVQEPDTTLAIGSGSCRDFAALFIEAVRRRGMAARFVTGYLCASTLTESQSTHAWAEVYLPDAGWTGFDPTLGLLAAENHVAVAVARESDQLPPVEGTFSGVAYATMDVDVRVDPLPV
jgi:transglutaminase-like putative cysteine protease